jgi:hypothetical protein
MKHPYLVYLKTFAYPSTIAIKFLMELCILGLVDFIDRTKRFISMIISIRILVVIGESVVLDCWTMTVTGGCGMRFNPKIVCIPELSDRLSAIAIVSSVQSLDTCLHETIVKQLLKH